MRIAVLPGDGIGPEIVPQAVRVLRAVTKDSDAFIFEEGAVGGAGLEVADDPLPPATLDIVLRSDAILFGAVGHPRYDHYPHVKKPGAALRRLRKELGLFANFRPVKLFPELIDASTLKPEVIDGLDLMIVRELNSDIYYGTPRGPVETPTGERAVINTMFYAASEVERIAHVAFDAARRRRRKVCSIDKANVLEASALWREVMSEVGRQYPDVELTHQLVDSAAMSLIRNPRQFDVIVAGNLFGDILSDQASMLTGSIGLLPSASLGGNNKGLYEPIHGSAPDIAGRDVANPIATILSAAMMLRQSFGMEAEALRVENAARAVLAGGIATPDLALPGARIVGTREMGDAIVAALA
ncbi:3-isopropylmalate dehydrogenase [Ancylobacter sp. Lp-2]|uniref:3-isopropylmalate dehydrogenase n=1 Tax=Ancylobacter sp. Lp-2 TaxID=2881339 RepID=UPI001E3C6764|nr:3-isopropylmalate dehydrogenase [Ancylobacter sp. Lp-2]MCB4771580.1 3-isopropylmalate dehydrogenase [Ancylobacter sp. Lp-2]